MKQYLIKKAEALFCLLNGNYMIVLGNKGYGRSYSWKDRHLFFENNK